MAIHVDLKHFVDNGVVGDVCFRPNSWTNNSEIFILTEREREGSVRGKRYRMSLIDGEYWLEVHPISVSRYGYASNASPIGILSEKDWEIYQGEGTKSEATGEDNNSFFNHGSPH